MSSLNDWGHSTLEPAVNIANDLLSGTRLYMCSLSHSTMTPESRTALFHYVSMDAMCQRE